MMHDIKVSDGIMPLGEFTANASKIIRQIGVSNDPLIITQNGRPAAVLISPAAFEQLCEWQEFLEAVTDGLADSEAGHGVDHGKVRRWLETWGTDRERNPPK